ncbi:MAG: twin-arginine translocase TatA/TatE family subunit [Planctomycetota bacterium]
MNSFFAFGIGTPEFIVIGIVGLLLYGRRLPEVGRSFGRTFFEFKRGLNDLRREFDDAGNLTRSTVQESRDHYRRHEEEVIKEAQAFSAGVFGGDEDPARDDEKPDGEGPETKKGDETSPSS